MTDQKLACPACGRGPILLVAVEIYEQVLDGASGVRSAEKVRVAVPQLDLDPGSRIRCAACRKTWSTRQFDPAWRAAGSPLLP